MYFSTSSQKSVVFGTIFVLVLCSNVGQAQLIPIFDWVMSFFGGYEEPPYTLVRNVTDGIEERIYPTKKWVCTEQILKPKTKDSKRSEMFMMLYKYIQGDNDADQRIEMTIPVITKVDHRNGEWYSYDMCFYIPQHFQRYPPRPTSRNVRIVSFPELHVFSQRFTGYATQELEEEHMLSLESTLRDTNISFYEEKEGPRATHFISGYDSPTKFWNRKNEVWILSSDNQKLPVTPSE